MANVDRSALPTHRPLIDFISRNGQISPRTFPDFIDQEAVMYRAGGLPADEATAATQNVIYTFPRTLNFRRPIGSDISEITSTACGPGADLSSSRLNKPTLKCHPNNNEAFCCSCRADLYRNILL